MIDQRRERLLILGVAMGLSMPIALFPTCSYVGAMVFEGRTVSGKQEGWLPVWTAFRAHQIQRDCVLRNQPYRPLEVEYVEVKWNIVLLRLVLVWGGSLAILIYRRGRRVSDRKAAFRYIVSRSGRAGALLGGAAVAGAVLLEPWARAIPSHNPFVGGSSHILDLFAALIATVLGYLVGSIVGAMLGALQSLRRSKHSSVSTVP